MNDDFRTFNSVYCSIHKVLFALLLLVAILSSNTVSGQKVPEKELINLIQGFEKNYKVLEYKMVFETSRILDAKVKVDFTQSISNLLNSAEPAGIRKKTNFLTEPGTGRIYFTREGTALKKSAGSPDVYIGKNRREIGFDGHTRSQLTGLSNMRQLAIIDEEPLHINKELSSFEMGMDALLPCYNGVGLSQYLQGDKVEKSTVQGVMHDDGTLEVDFFQTDKQKIRLVIDIEKGGAILSEEYYSKRSSDTVVVKMEYTWDQDSRGYWVPRRGVGVAGLSMSTVYSWSFDEFQANHFEPTQKNYRVDFPFGTEVEDRVAGIHYVVGELPSNVKHQVRETFLETIEMNPSLSEDLRTNQVVSESDNSSSETAGTELLDNVNDDKAISAETELPEDERTSRGVFWVLGFAVLFAVILFFVRSRKNTSVTMLMVLVFISFFIMEQNCFAATSDNILTDSFDGWTSRGPGGIRIPVYQCGYNSTVYIFEYFNLRYKNKQLMNLMTPSIEGIPLSDIIRTLRLHGMEVNARKGANVDDLFNHITENQIALLPTDTSGKKGHYYVLVPGRKSDFLLVDAGFSVTNCSKDKIQKMLKQNNGVIVFITSNKKKSDASIINVSKVKYNIGKFANNSRKEVVAKYVLENSSTEEVLLKDVSASCSCTAVKCIGSVIKGKEKLEANMLIMPSSWGIGKKTKSVLFVFGDGSSKKVEIEGECIDEEGLHNLKVSPSEVYIDINNDAKDGVVYRKVKVFTKEEAIHVSSEADWLLATLSKKDDNDFRTIEIQIDVDKLKEQQTATHLTIWSKENISKIKLPIYISTPRQFTIKPRIGKIDLGNEELNTVRFDVEPLFENDLKIVNALSSSDISLDWTNATKGNNKLIASLRHTDIKLGLHPIEVKVSVDGNIYTERVYVLIK